MALTSTQRGVIEFESSFPFWRFAGAKEQRIREIFEISANRYYQILNNAIDDPEALEIDPVLVNRLRRRREENREIRAARRMLMRG